MIIYAFSQRINLQSLFCDMNHCLDQQERRNHPLGGGAGGSKEL